MTAAGTECLSCKSIAGKVRISPGSWIYEGRYWLVDHAYPTSLPGWLVIVLKRHSEALHDLTQEEFAELGLLQYHVSQALHDYFDCLKEYSVLFAEGAGFPHIHFHMIPRSADLPAALKGPAIFALLRPDPGAVVPPDTVRTISADLRHMLESRIAAQ